MTNDFGNMFSGIIYDENIRTQFDEFSKNYSDKSEREIYREIDRVQSEVSNDIKKRHIKNLETLAQMEGFINERTVRDITRIKRLIRLDETSSSNTKNIETQYTSPTSLLLWFLLLTSIWRGRYRRGFYY